ncbi:hypothetical protein ACHHYP_01879 [Achlya hypogyna]|uniref:EF-hand domain-containing protein n=1 Tax=Achlya hypogyna TaxID=1202772 RepID=A0A1V9ZSX4_ACHHY|nr:hypothetical protein ACHHYP_01879 [Achlya hypogyna]
MSCVDVPYTSQRLRFVVEPSLVDEIFSGTTALRKGCHLHAFKDSVVSGKHLEREEFLSWMKTASGIQTDRDFRSAHALLELVFHTFSTYSVDMVDLAIGAMVVLDGSTEDKLRCALELLCDDFPLVTEGVLVRALTDFLLGLYCLFAGDDTSHAPDATLETIEASATKTVQSLLEQTPTLSFEAVWDWYLLVGATEAPYLRLLDMDRWAPAVVSPPPSTADGGVLFGFVTDATVVGITEAHAAELEELLLACRFPVLAPQTLYDTFLHHTLDGMLDEATFIEGVNELTCMTCTNHVMDDDKFMTTVRALFKQYVSHNATTTVDAFELAAGFAIFAHGSKSDKLAAGFHFFDTDDRGFLTKGQLWRFLRSVVLTMLGLAPPAGVASLVALVDDGATTVLDALDDDTYTFETFGRWYNQGGFQVMSWLELLDLKKWIFVAPDFNTSILDKTPVQPVSASMYYTAKNIRATNQKDVQSSTGTDDGLSESALLPIDSIPPLCLKNDIVLAFDLLLESDAHPIQNLAFDNGDLIHYQQLQAATQLQALEVTTAHGLLAPHVEMHGGIGTLDKARFDECMASLLPPDAEARALLTALFFAYNRTGTGKIDATEFISGFLLLVGGSKSAKLAFCFGLFDEDADGYLTRREMWKYLRSFLTMLLALGNGADLSADTIGYICDAACISIAKSIFNESASGLDVVMKTKVCFAEFADWYSEKGYALIPWIELLDARKWPVVDDSIADAVASFSAASVRGQQKEQELVNTTTTVVSSTGYAPTTTGDGYKDSSAVVFQFKLTSYDATMLRIRLRDVAVVSTIADKLRLRQLPTEGLYSSLDRFAKGKCLTKSGFLYAIRSLAPKEGLSSEDQEFLSYHLLRLFALYETESNLDDDDDAEVMSITSAVDKLHLLSGLSILCAGSKSAKLGVLFTLFDYQREGAISRRSLFELFKAVLALLFSFSLAESATSSANVFAAERAAGALTSQVFCETHARTTISLATFAEWYSSGGYQSCPWLELLDLNKWPTQAAMEAHARERPLAYAFDMHEEGSLLQYSEKDIETYLSMLDATQFPSLPVVAIHDTIVANARPHGHTVDGGGLVISRASFYSCIRKLIPRTHINQEGQHLASRLLARLFGVYDRKKTGKVQALELACGLTILGQGSKSQKLAAAFDLLVKVANKGHPSQTKLPHGMLFLFLRSFLLALMVLSEARHRRGLEHMYVEADEVVGEATTKVLAEITMDTSLRTRNRISFEQFGEWYNGGGYETLSWVELLDVSKWQHQTSAPATQHGVRASDIGLTPPPAPEPPVLTMALAAPAAALRYTASDLTALRECLEHVELHLYAPLQLITVLKSFLKRHQAPSTDLLSPTVQVGLTKEQFRAALLQLCATHAHCTNSFVTAFADHVFAVFAAEKVPPLAGDDGRIRARAPTVPLVHLLCGLMVFTDASLLAILLQGTALLCFTAFTEQLVDEVSQQHFVPRAILAQALENFLKMLYACSGGWDRMDVAEMEASAKAGAKACVAGFCPGGPDEMVSLEAFDTWFEEAGAESHAWLRLVVLEHWPTELGLNMANRASSSSAN